MPIGKRIWWRQVRDSHERIRASVLVARVAADRARLHLVRARAFSSASGHQAAQRYDVARRLLDRVEEELDAIEAFANDRPRTPGSWRRNADRRSGLDRRGSLDRRTRDEAVPYERRQGSRRRSSGQPPTRSPDAAPSRPDAPLVG